MLTLPFTLTTVMCKGAWSVETERLPWASISRKKIWNSVMHGVHIFCPVRDSLFSLNSGKVVYYSSPTMALDGMWGKMQPKSTQVDLCIESRDWKPCSGWWEKQAVAFQWGYFRGKHGLRCNGIDKSVLKFEQVPKQRWRERCPAASM